MGHRTSSVYKTRYPVIPEDRCDEVVVFIEFRDDDSYIAKAHAFFPYKPEDLQGHSFRFSPGICTRHQLKPVRYFRKPFGRP